VSGKRRLVKANQTQLVSGGPEGINSRLMEAG
jgi:hypothetical protein